MVKLFGKEIRLRNPVVTEKSPSESLVDAQETVNNFKEFLTHQKCPNCSKNGDFTLLFYEYGAKGWEMKYTCKNCQTMAILNHTGFHYEFTRREGTT